MGIHSVSNIIGQRARKKEKRQPVNIRFGLILHLFNLLFLCLEHTSFLKSKNELGFADMFDLFSEILSL